MLSDNILQFNSTSTIQENTNSYVVRKNPFNNDTKDIISQSLRSDISISSMPSSIFVSNHFDDPVGHIHKKSPVEDLTVAIKDCKLKILNLVDNQESKDKWIERLIELNEALHTAKETLKERKHPEILSFISANSDNSFVEIAGHKLLKFRNGFGPRHYCEVCNGVIRTARSFYRCQECDVFIHASTNCLPGLHRACPASDIGHPSLLQSQIISRRRFSSADSNQNIDIDSYPITGSLARQKFLCAECNHTLRPISATDPDYSQRSPPKFCHYYRKFYCRLCHWDNKYVIPSVYFMLNKWKEMSVCRSAYIKLKYMWNRALFRMPLFWEENSPGIVNILIIRKKLFLLRCFIHKCPALRKIGECSPMWLIEQPYLVTMQFVESVHNGTGLEVVQSLYSSLVVHILQCELCQQLSAPCHLCQDPERLSILSRSVWSCCRCSVTCIHETCAQARLTDKSQYVCPNCSKD